MYCHVLMVGNGNHCAEWHRDVDPLTAVIASFVRDQNIWIFASQISAASSYLTNDEVIWRFLRFVEDLMHGRFRDLYFCVQYPGDTVAFIALTGHFVISATSSNGWQVLLTHNVLREEASARTLEITALIVNQPQRGRRSRGEAWKRNGATKSRFGVRRGKKLQK